FGWWINRLDPEGHNVFEGGFLGLDNVSVFDRSEPLPAARSGVRMMLQQADATGWMGLFCLNLMRIALELAQENPVYEGLAITFLRYFLSIVRALHGMTEPGQRLWDERDGFFYDVLRSGDEFFRVRVRSVVGLIPLFAVELLPVELLGRFPRFAAVLDGYRR